MLCQDCKKREAQVHLTQIINNEKTALSLCKECASARGFHPPLDNAPFPLAEILSGLAQNLGASGKSSPPADSLVCPSCHLSFEDFMRQGRFGCGECYRTFRPQLESIMRKIHGASLHRGKAPVAPEDSETAQAIPVKEEERLEIELRKAIESEDFERAAELRDKLKSIKRSVELR